MGDFLLQYGINFQHCKNNGISPPSSKMKIRPTDSFSSME